jgi:hypothetical protein
MSKSIDKLSKDLASGVSRRKALWSFVTGLGAVGAIGAFGAKKATAASNVNLLCQISCTTQAQDLTKACRAFYGNNVVREVVCNGVAAVYSQACLAFSAHCRSGFCAEFIGFSGSSGGDLSNASLYSSWEENESGFVCIPSVGLI